MITKDYLTRDDDGCLINDRISSLDEAIEIASNYVNRSKNNAVIYEAIRAIKPPQAPVEVVTL